MSDSQDPNAVQLANKRSLFPPLFSRLKQQLEDPTALPEPSGANVTLDDLAKLAELREAANPTYVPGPPMEPGEKVCGWVGTPDPKKFAAGTNSLSAEEAIEEATKGNIILFDDWVKQIRNLDLWQKRLLYKAMVADWMQNKFFVKMEDGRKVSFWDLYRYVYHNPELKALVESRNSDVPLASVDGRATGDASSAGPRLAPGLYDDPGSGQWQSLNEETARQMPWGLAGRGQVWGRRPTRWLWGADAQLDMSFAMYVHEDAAHEVLGPQYRGQDPRVCLSDEQYRRDIMRGGPLMGMTFMLTAARELPAQDMCSAWAGRIAKRLQSLPSPQRPLPPANSSSDPGTAPLVGALRPDKPDESIASPSMQALFDAYCLFDPERLSSQTELMDLAGRNLKPGSSVIVTLGPEGLIRLQAMTPGSARERQCYHLGDLRDQGLAAAVVEEFLGEDAVDPDFASAIPGNMLMFANGFKVDNTDDNPNVRLSSDGPGYRTEIIPARSDVFRLPKAGGGGAVETPPVLLSGLRERVMVSAMADVYGKAYATVQGMAVEGATDADLRLAASKEIKNGLTSLGLNVQGLRQDIFGNARPLAEEEFRTLWAAADTPGRPTALRKARLA